MALLRVATCVLAAVSVGLAVEEEVCRDASCHESDRRPADGGTGGWAMIQHKTERLTRMTADGVERAGAALGGDCGACAKCLSVPDNPQKQAVTDADCAPCALGQQPWWPCNVAGLCRCDAPAAPTTAAPTTPRPTPAPATTTKATAPTTKAPTTTTPTAPTTKAPTTATPTAPTTKAPTTATPTAPTTKAPATTAAPTPSPLTTAQAPSPTPAALSCSTCSTCVAVPGNSQAASDASCAPCAGGRQAWWPCTVQGLCQCSSSSPSPSPSPTPMPTPSPTTATASTTKAASPTPAPTSVNGTGTCTATAADCAFTAGAGISKWFTQELFNSMFPNICNSACHGCQMLTYSCLIKATLMYPTFANSGNIDNDKRELAAWLGEMSQETTGGGCGASIQLADGSCSCGPMWCDSQPNGGCAAWGLCFVEEAPGTAYCSPSSDYPCTAGKEYRGRGPVQLSWNYNYGQFSEAFCGKKQTLLDNPDWVATNPTLAWASSIWFWFTGGACLPWTGEICKPSCHDVFLGLNKMCPSDVQAGRKYGLGWVTNVINGGLECGGAGSGMCDYRVHSRVRFYTHFCDVLGVNPLAAGWTVADNLYCATQKSYAYVSATTC